MCARVLILILCYVCDSLIAILPYMFTSVAKSVSNEPLHFTPGRKNSVSSITLHTRIQSSYENVNNSLRSIRLLQQEISCSTDVKGNHIPLVPAFLCILPRSETLIEMFCVLYLRYMP
jgi:hypothetical protein